MNHSEKHADKIYYEQAGAELHSGNIDRGLMVKAIAQCKGNKQEAELIYVEWRVEILKEEEIERIKREAYLQEVANEKTRAELERKRKRKEGIKRSKWIRLLLFVIIVIAHFFLLLYL